jgi:protein-S-isoprenylcysteine O-methyltransferase Ste14
MADRARWRARLAAAFARWRVRLGYILGIVVFWLASPTPRSLVLGASVGATGEALRIWAAGHLEKSREVTSSGPYMFTRHPLYVGSIVLGVGFAIAANNVITAVIVATYLAVTITAAIRAEEEHLTDKFGEAYPAYRNGHTAETSRRFSVERALRNREYRALAGFIVVIALLAARLVL